MPLGFMAITVGIVTVIFSMVGAEIATIAAAESEDPERAVTKAANSVIVRLKVKMWLFPVLSILTAVAILAILVQMGLQKDIRSQLILSLLSWAVVLLLYFANKWYINRRPEAAGVAQQEASPGARAGQRDRQLRGTARRTSPHRGGHCRHLLRGRAGQSDRDRNGGHGMVRWI